MQLESILEKPIGKESIEKLAKKVLKGDIDIIEVIDLITNNQEPTARRAAWLLTKVAEDDPSMVDPFVTSIVKVLTEEHTHTGTIRSILKVFEFTVIPEEIENLILEKCFQYITETKWPSAIQAFAISVIERLCNKYPELINELEQTIRISPNNEKPAYKARGRMVMKKLRKIRN
jgi:hypothetical protein